MRTMEQPLTSDGDKSLSRINKVVKSKFQWIGELAFEVTDTPYGPLSKRDLFAFADPMYLVSKNGPSSVAHFLADLTNRKTGVTEKEKGALFVFFPDLQALKWTVLAVVIVGAARRDPETWLRCHLRWKERVPPHQMSP